MAEAPDLDDVPDTKDLVLPAPHELPHHTLANTLAIRAIRREIVAGKTWLWRIVLAVIGGSATVATSVIGGAAYVGARTERVEQHGVEIGHLDDRLTHVEREMMKHAAQ